MLPHLQTHLSRYNKTNILKEEGIYGEVYVNCDRALAAAPKRRGWSPAKELLLYIAHGIDHLSGADDFSPKDYQAMRRRELSWIKDLTVS